MRWMHSLEERGSKGFASPTEEVPLGADWPQRPLSPMPVPPLQAVKR